MAGVCEKDVLLGARLACSVWKAPTHIKISTTTTQPFSVSTSRYLAGGMDENFVRAVQNQREKTQLSNQCLTRHFCRVILFSSSAHLGARTASATNVGNLFPRQPTAGCVVIPDLTMSRYLSRGRGRGGGARHDGRRWCCGAFEYKAVVSFVWSCDHGGETAATTFSRKKRVGIKARIPAPPSGLACGC